MIRRVQGAVDWVLVAVVLLLISGGMETARGRRAIERTVEGQWEEPARPRARIGRYRNDGSHPKSEWSTDVPREVRGWRK